MPLPDYRALLWLDTETTGLDYGCSHCDTGDLILEVAWILTDLDLNVIHRGHVLAATFENALVALASQPEVFAMHTRNGLLDALRNQDPTPFTERDGLPIEVDSYLANTLKTLSYRGRPLAQHEIALAGSGVGHFDSPFMQRWMPLTRDHLHPSPLDIGTIRRAARMWAPGWIPDSNDSKPHRASDDVAIHLSDAQIIRERFQATVAASAGQVTPRRVIEHLEAWTAAGGQIPPGENRRWTPVEHQDPLRVQWDWSHTSLRTWRLVHEAKLDIPLLAVRLLPYPGSATPTSKDEVIDAFTEELIQHLTTPLADVPSQGCFIDDPLVATNQVCLHCHGTGLRSSTIRCLHCGGTGEYTPAIEDRPLYRSHVGEPDLVKAIRDAYQEPGAEGRKVLLTMPALHQIEVLLTEIDRLHAERPANEVFVGQEPPGWPTEVPGDHAPEPGVVSLRWDGLKATAEVIVAWVNGNSADVASYREEIPGQWLDGEPGGPTSSPIPAAIRVVRADGTSFEVQAGDSLVRDGDSWVVARPKSGFPEPEPEVAGDGTGEPLPPVPDGDDRWKYRVTSATQGLIDEEALRAAHMTTRDIRTTNLYLGPQRGGLHVCVENTYEVVDANEVVNGTRAADARSVDLGVTLEVGTWAEGDDDPSYGPKIPVSRRDLLDVGVAFCRLATEPGHWPDDPPLRHQPPKDPA